MMVPEVPELPEIQDASMNAFNTHLYKALPGMPQLRWDSILGYNPREVAAQQYAAELAAAYESTRIQNKAMEARARAHNRMAQKEAERY
tara:strand:+ start:475 stop:741 length:267 start_codon:yes stop_codon:yes gene_type:complete